MLVRSNYVLRTEPGLRDIKAMTSKADDLRIGTLHALKFMVSISDILHTVHILNTYAFIRYTYRAWFIYLSLMVQV